MKNRNEFLLVWRDAFKQAFGFLARQTRCVNEWILNRNLFTRSTLMWTRTVPADFRPLANCADECLIEAHYVGAEASDWHMQSPLIHLAHGLNPSLPSTTERVT